MKIPLMWLLVLISMAGGYAQTSDCYKSLRTGNFVYVESPDVTIKRTRTIQTETYNNGKSKLIMNIRWVSDTEYLLIFKKAVNASGPLMQKGDILDVKILSCHQGEYTYKFRSIRNGEILLDDIPGTGIKKVD